MQQLTLKVRRQEAGAKPGDLKDYKVEVADNATVMDALLKVRDEQDPSLAMRANCMSALCGDCMVRVNGGAQLACAVPCSRAARNGEIRVEPVAMAKVQKDLVLDMDQFLWDKIKAVQPGITVANPPGKEELSIEPKVIDDLQNVMSCYNCGICDDGCVVIVVDKSYIGPAALTKAYRAITDPRDQETNKRLDMVDVPRGAWDCAHCYEANSNCPRGIDPTTRIVQVRDMIIKHGVKFPGAAKHHHSMQNSIKHTGSVDEGRLTIESIGYTNLPGIIAFIPTALTALRRNKAPMPYLHPKRPGAEHIRRIIEKAERKGHGS
jgi:succinate dehydrogenase / fumarate reductase iron-sulfur subunit